MATSTQLQSQYNDLRSQKKTLESRVRQLKSVQNSMNYSLPGYATKVNTSIGGTRTGFRSGLTGATSKTSVDSALTDLVQKNVSTDSELSSTLNNIEDEISRCNRKISDLSTEMTSTQNAIWAARTREAQEAAEAAAAALAAALTS